MDISLATDMAEVKEIISLPEIWDRIGDKIDLEDYNPRNGKYSQWLKVTDEDKTIGVLHVHHDTSETLKLHVHMVKGERHKKYDMMREFFKWFLTLNVNKLIVSIPTCYQQIIDFAMDIGFKDEGVNRESIARDGKYYDQVNLGLTQTEIRGLI